MTSWEAGILEESRPGEAAPVGAGEAAPLLVGGNEVEGDEAHLSYAFIRLRRLVRRVHRRSEEIPLTALPWPGISSPQGWLNLAARSIADGSALLVRGSSYFFDQISLFSRLRPRFADPTAP